MTAASSEEPGDGASLAEPSVSGTVMVIGAGGLVGRATCGLLARTRHRVVGLDRVSTVITGPQPDVTVTGGDVLDLSSLLRRFAEWDVRTVVHAAAISHPTVSIELPLATVQANCVGTATVLEACRIAGVRRLVFLSSECVYGNQPDTRLDEDAALRPRTPYAASKVFGESLARAYEDLWGIQQVSLRLTHIYGPGNAMPDGVTTMLRQALCAGEIKVRHGAQNNQLLHVDDAARAIQLVVDQARCASGVYNIGPGERTSNEDLARCIAEVTGCAVRVLDTTIAPELDQLGVIACDRAQHEFGFRSEVCLDAGLSEFASWLRNAGRESEGW